MAHLVAAGCSSTTNTLAKLGNRLFPNLAGNCSLTNHCGNKNLQNYSLLLSNKYNLLLPIPMLVGQVSLSNKLLHHFGPKFYAASNHVIRWCSSRAFVPNLDGSNGTISSCCPVPEPSFATNSSRRHSKSSSSCGRTSLVKTNALSSGRFDATRLDRSSFSGLLRPQLHYHHRGAVMGQSIVRTMALAGNKKLEFGGFSLRKKKFVNKIASDAVNMLLKDCLNGYDFEKCIKEFALEDRMESWFTLSLLHLWMCLARLTLEKDETYLYLRNRMIELLWMEVEDRLRIVLAKGFHGRKRRVLFNLYNDMNVFFLEMDEGLLSDDKALAGALWRNVHFSKLEDPLPLNKLVRYTRANIHLLTSTESGPLFTKGITWEFPV